jgi:hypothetical protein
MTTAHSEAWDKQIWHRRLRARERTAINSLGDYDDLQIPLVREVSSTWTMAKDGKHRYTAAQLERWWPNWKRK